MSHLKFKNSINQWLTRGLFYEFDYDEVSCMFTLKDYDWKSAKTGKVYPSLRIFYMSCEDPTEYEFANKYLGGWNHCQKILRSGLLEPYIETWRRELEVKLRSKALEVIRDLQKETDDKRIKFETAKFLLNGSWDRKRKGRPSKEDIINDADARSRIIDDFNRIVSTQNDLDLDVTQEEITKQ